MTPPQIDVLMPAYNCALTLRSSVESILNQSFDGFRILLLDDGSTDETPAICEELARQDPRIKYVAGDSNEGIVARLNRGLELSSALYIARMDADDISFSHRFDRQIEFMSANPCVVACSASYECIDDQGEVFDTHLANNRPPKLDAIPARPHFLLHPLLMVRRAALIKIGGYRNILHCEDADLYYRLSQHGVLHNLAAILGQYRIHDASVSIRTPANRIIQCLNSQLLALYALHQTQDKTWDDLPEYITERVVTNIPPHSISLTTAHEKLESHLKLDKRYHDWLKIAVFAKYLQESRLRKFHISEDDFVTVMDLTRNILSFPRKYRIPFLSNVRKWHASLSPGDRMNRYKFNTTGRIYIALDEMRKEIYRKFSK